MVSLDATVSANRTRRMGPAADGRRPRAHATASPMNLVQARRLLGDAMDHHRRGNLPAAEAGYREILRRTPDNADALHLLGTIVCGRGDLADGIALIERSLALNPKSPEAHYNIGNILRGLDR